MALMRRLLPLLALTAAAAAAEWSQLPPLPDPEGFAGAFAGTSGGVLMVAGGTNFPDKMPWEGGAKVWYDTVHVLRSPEAAWEKAGRLPKANGYGVSLSTPEGLLIIGGGNTTEHFRDVLKLTWRDGKILSDALPPLPRPLAFMAGTLAGNILYLAGGISKPDDTAAQNVFWSFDLHQPQRGWQSLPPCPGPARILASMATFEGSVYLFSGAALRAGADGKAARDWLRDAWRFRPDKGWQQLQNLPHVAVAAPSPLPLRERKLLLIGGDDGNLANFEPKSKHPGFPRRLMSYDPAQDRWKEAGSLPFSLVTTPAVEWRGRIVIPGGEARPGKRSPEVWWR